jgi:carbonic anhydrase
MKKQVLPLLLCGLLASTTSYAEGKVHWGYSGDVGPEHWARLSAEFGTCGSGKNQSPVNLSGMIKGNLPKMKVNYKVGGKEIINNGHTIQVNYAPGSTITVNGHTFELKQFHFHSPSENTIEGHSYPMEAHFVHADKDGNLAVIAVMYKLGEYNTELEKAWKFIPHEVGASNELHNMVSAKALLPHKHDYFRFNGSLTTPPCTEGVNWFVMKFFDTASQAQIDKFVHTMHHDNNRPLQPLNARLVIK